MIKRILLNNIGIFCALIFSVVASLPLFHFGFFPMHDNEQIARLFDLNQALGLGQFPPRIAPNLGFGYGYPFFNFYPSFAYYVGEIFHLLGFGYILSTKIMLFFGFFLAAYFMYLLSKEFFGEAAGVIAACAYTFIPYHSVDIYVRGAFAEFFAFVFLPLVFWSIVRLAKTLDLKYVVITALSVACLILSHDLIAFMSTPFIAIWLLYFLLTSSNKKKFIYLSAFGFLLGFGLSAYFFIPSYFEKDFTLIRILTSELADYNLHFVCIHQLWNSAWGYGGSIPDCNDGLSFEVGKIQLIASIVAVVLFGYFFVKRKIKKEYFVIPVAFVLLLLSMFLAVRESKFIWDMIPPLAYVQFPWRFLTLSDLAASFLAGSLVVFIKNKNVQLGFAIILVFALIAFNISDFAPEKYINVKDNYYTNTKMIRWNTSSLSYEYVPVNISIKKSKDNTTLVNINESEIKSSPYEVVKGSMNVNVEKDLPQEKVFNVDSADGGMLQISTYSFPGWQVFINNQKVFYSDNNKLRLIDVAVPAGQNTIHAVFENTQVRSVSNLISIISIIILCGVGIVSFKKSKR